MSVDRVRLELDVTRFDPVRCGDVTGAFLGSGITLTTLAELGNTIAHQRLLYELNAECAADIPYRGPLARVSTTAARHLAMIALNRRLGYVDAGWAYPPLPGTT